MKEIKKILFVFILSFFIFSARSYAEIVNKVEAKGNERITLETIVIFADIVIGKNYESSDINTLIKKLYETNFFSNISVELQNGKLSINVKENPIINEIQLKNEKAGKHREKIKQILTLREKTSFMSNYVKPDINVIKEFYRQLGFYFVEIDVEIERLTKNRVNLIYTIDKGKKAKISKIYFLGDKKIRDKRLRDIITSEESKFWKFISRNVYLNKGIIELDKRLLKNYYKNKGYYEVNIASSNVEYSEGEGFVLTYSINAGKRYKFSKIFADVVDSLDQTAFLSLEKDFNKIIGEYYSQKKLTSILEKIDKLSEQKELQFINHEVTETLDGDGVQVKIHIFEGDKFTIERINIVGNSVTNDSVIRGEMKVDEGDPYSALLVNKSINKLKSRGLFGAINKKITEGSSPNLKVLEISIEEKATGEIVAGIGIGTDGKSFQFAVKENNWLGKGIKLNTALNISEETISGSLALREPNYNSSGNAVWTAVDVASSDRTETSGYESKKTGFSLGTSFEQYEDIYISPGLTATYENITAKSNASASIKKMDGSFNNMDFTYSISQDKRNQVFQPTAGYKIIFTQGLPLIQDSSSIMHGFNFSKYHGFSDDVVGSVKFYGRTMHGVDDDVRLTSRLFIPANKLRGFSTKKVGPKDGEDWIGGNYTTSLGFEVQLPNLLPESTRTDFSVFLDTANVWAVDYDAGLDESKKIRSSIGIAANVFTTIGPLSFTLAQDLSKASSDVTETFNFRLGTSF